MDDQGGTRPDLLSLKPTAVPRLPLVLLARSRLVAKLDDTADTVLICAPAGYGKTVLLSQWLEDQAHKVAWLSPNQHNREALWPAMLQALRRCPAIPPGALRQFSGDEEDAVEVLGDLAQELASTGTTVRLVIDGVDGFSSDERERWIPALHNQSGPPIQLALVARDSTAVDAGPARLSGRIVELRSSDLAFSLEEINVLAAKTTTLTGVNQRRELFRQTAGWPACVVLALRYLREAADTEAPLGDIAANNRQLSDYLDHHIIRTLSGEERHVLSSTSVCRVVVAAQANTLAGHRNAGSILSSLADDRDLVESAGSGRKVFLVHPLIRAFFRAELARKQPDELLRFSRIAAQWHEQAGEPEATLRHALDSADNGLIGEVLERHGASLLGSGEVMQVRRAIAALPDAAFATNPTLCVVAALAHVESRQPTTATRYMAAANRTRADDLPPDLRELQALAKARLSWFNDGWEDQDPQATADYAALRFSRQSDVRIEARMVSVTAALVEGKYGTAENEASAALMEATEAGNAYLAGKVYLKLAATYSMQGQLRRASHFLRLAEDKLPAHVWTAGAGRSVGALMHASAALLRAEPAEALRFAAAGVAELGQLGAASKGVGAAMRATLEIITACAHMDSGDRRNALEGMRQARLRIGRDHLFAQPLAACIAVIEHTAALVLGHADHAREVLEWAEERIPGTGELCLLRAQGPAGISRFDAAADRLKPFHTGAVKPVLEWTRLHVNVLECSMAIRTGRRSLAGKILEEALRQADDLDVLRPLAIAPHEVIDLLVERAGSYGPQETLAQRLLVLRPPTDARRAQALTPREREVLTLLPSHLSQEQMAAELHLSVNTVKTHVRIIYSKLGAGSRHDAVAAAYKSGYLP
ncbi:LuxR family maltose regulon positive regulatory protein [Pseudarthrobacter sp. PvP004]|uniref:LuxR C-terminal-related transcriptional regulator n=1 Tax=Pseudarthrobacter sp. PvP004 TaxID=2817850 RepID=UPI001AE4864A|nr:LuxR C-terminal-related transcriptional regulator [Pseudarthrobacter sp. PvP004]MBP2268453.1 LuxR family maltose regulon positive regulatory protein [Pseudarthrobacter sp. PvP004]